MGTSIEREEQIVLLKSAWLQPSNKIATHSNNFERNATYFEKGTIFQDFGSGDSEKYSLHGWCYKKDDTWYYCNFHRYILDHWKDHKGLFNIYD